MTPSKDDILAVNDREEKLCCKEYAEEILDMKSIGSNQVITRDEAEREGKLNFCDVCPDRITIIFNFMTGGVK